MIKPQQQTFLNLGSETVPEPKPKPTKMERAVAKRAKEQEKAIRQKERNRRAFFGRTSYGKTIPQPYGANGQCFDCPCGRVYLMAHADGFYILVDKLAPLGGAAIKTQNGKRYETVNLREARQYLEKNGCELHPGVPWPTRG